MFPNDNDSAIFMNKHPYEDPQYWSTRATCNGVATLGWSSRLNDFYYSIKERYVTQLLDSLPNSATVLEVGCGVGRIGKYIHHLRPDIILIGADFSEGMLDAALGAQAYTALIKADIAELPFCSRSFDLVLAMDVLFHVVRVDRKGYAWNEMARVAKTYEGVAAYSSSYELTSLPVIEKLMGIFFPIYWVNKRLYDQITVWLTIRCDKGQRQ